MEYVNTPAPIFDGDNCDFEHPEASGLRVGVQRWEIPKLITEIWRTKLNEMNHLALP